MQHIIYITINYICFTKIKNISILKKVIIVLFILYAGFEVCAQSDEFKPRYAFGIKQGINNSSVSFKPGISQGINLGYSGGLVYKHRNEKLFGLQLELNFCQKGWTEDLDTINNSYKRSLNYIELPFITQIVMGKRLKIKYYVNLGTSVAYLLSEKEDLVVNNELYRREYYEKKVENAFDYSGLGELGIIYYTGVGEFQVGVRYQRTFTDLFKTTETTEFRNSQSQLWSFLVSYFFLDNRE